MSEPKTVTRELFIYHSDYEADKILVCGFEMPSYKSPLLGKVSVSFEIPQIDIVKAKIDLLEKEITTIQANTHIKVTNLKEQIQSLLAIGHD